MTLGKLKDKVLKDSLYKNSFWAVFGNGTGNFLLLLSGIFIARELGKDLYGEYGMVKTTMFTMATFATLAIGNTSTKFIAEYIQKDISCVRNIILTSLKIVLSFSLLMCAFLFVFSDAIANFVNEPKLSTSFKVLGVIIVFRALNTVGAGILGGFKDFKQVGINNIVAGITMFTLCIPLTRLYSISGAFVSLLTSQVCLCILNVFFVLKRYKSIKEYSSDQFGKKILVFSFPFALNEFVYTVTAWGNSLILTKYASLGDLGMYTACIQWNSIIMFVPGLLGNVILSYLSTSAVADNKTHDKFMLKMLMVNFLCTLFPLIVVAFSSNLISDYYGSSFSGLNVLLLISIWGTIFICLSRVFDSNLMSEGKRWTSFAISSSLNVLEFLIAFALLSNCNGHNAAKLMIYLYVAMSIFKLLIYIINYRWRRSPQIC